MRKSIATLICTLVVSSLGAMAPEVAVAATAPLAGASASSAPHALAASGENAKKLDGQLNINTANETQWALLPGIGPATAKKLVNYRSNKPFANLNHVMRIKGIGRKTYADIKPFLSLKGPTTLQRAGK